MKETVLWNEWSFLVVFVGFETYYQKIWNYSINSKFEVFTPNFVFFGTVLGHFSQCNFKTFPRRPIPSSSIKKLPTALNIHPNNLCKFWRFMVYRFYGFGGCLVILAMRLVLVYGNHYDKQILLSNVSWKRYR